MADKDHRPGDAAAPQRDLRRPTSEAGFDRWLVGQMRKLYDQVLEEPVPEDLVQIVRSFDADADSEGTAEAEKSDDRCRSGKAPRKA